jgi:hypothetical protein
VTFFASFQKERWNEMKIGDLVSYAIDGFIEAGYGVIIEMDVPDHLIRERSFRILWNGHPPLGRHWCYESELVIVNESR